MNPFLLTIAVWLLLALIPSYAGILYVNAEKGSDSNTGLNQTQALKTIQRASELAKAGDEVIIEPGIYYERVQVPQSNRGESEKPIIFRADRIEQGRVVITGADRTIREGNGELWELVDESLGLYAVRFSQKEGPARVTYDNVDLYPYASLDELKSFRTVWEGGSPAPKHGFHYDAEKGLLYVRLHASRHGNPDPNMRIMAVSPRSTTGRAFSITGPGPAYIVIEGITFETPGDSAIYTEASMITIRDCWFFGCPYAVRGNNRGTANKEGTALWDTASNILIEHCEMTEISTFSDATEILEESSVLDGNRAPWSAVWHRKTTGKHGMPQRIKNYENGIAVHIGRGWIIRNNFIHDIFEGLANDGMSNAVDVEISGNIFARICDNAIETENHARNIRITRNLFLDVFEPFSWQPHAGPPWPGPIFFSQNVIANTSRNAEIWSRASHERGVFKMGISLKNWRGGKNADVSKTDLAVPLPGLIFTNNTIGFPWGRLVNLMGSRDVPIKNVFFIRNLIVTDFTLSLQPENDLKPEMFSFLQNLVAPSMTDMPGPGRIVAGPPESGGEVFSNAAALGLPDLENGSFNPGSNSPPTRNPKELTTLPPGIPLLPFYGALQAGEEWFPPSVGPRIASE